MLVRIKRKLYEEPLESVVLNREEATLQKRATVNDLRHALQDTSLHGPQVFRLLSTTPDASLPSNLLDTIARRKKEWASRPRRTSPRKNVKTSFEPQQQQVTGNLLLQQSKASRQARVWNCRRTKVQGFSVLELSGENNQEEGGERRKRPVVHPLNANRLRELEQEAKARLTESTTKSLKQARGWRKWQQDHRAEQQEQPPQAPSDAAPLPEQYAELLREYYGDDIGELHTPVNISVSTSAFPHALPLSSVSSPSASHSSTTSSCPLPSSSAASSLPHSSDPMDNSHDYNSDDNGERDYVWDLYYCCGSEMEDPNAERLTYRSAGEESEDPNEKEHDYSDEEEEEGDSSGEEEESEDSDCVLNKRVARIEQEDEEGDEEEEGGNDEEDDE